jgi:diguanylate cyclase (GGDEF)-like protein
VKNRDEISGAVGKVLPEDPAPASGAPTKRRRVWSGKIHRVYFVLAAIDLLVMVASLSLAHHGNTLLYGAVQSTLTRNALLANIDELRTLAGRVSAPGNDVFQSKEPTREAAQLKSAITETRHHIDSLLTGLANNDEEWLLAQQRVHIRKIDDLILGLAVQARSVLGAYQAGDIDTALARSARLNQQLRYVHFTIGKAAEAMRKAEASEKVSRLEISHELSYIEAMLAIIVLSVVGCVTIYGNRLARLFQAQNDELASFNDALEARVADRTAELAAANVRTQALNSELALKVRELRDAQAEMIRKDELILQNARFDAALQHMPIGMSWFDSESRLVTCNRAYLEVYGFAPEMAQAGSSIDAHFRAIKGLIPRNEDPRRAELLDEHLTQHRVEMDSGGRWTTESELSESKIVRVTSGPIPNGGWIFIHEDITDERRRAAKIEHLSGHDSLTDLPNRMLLRAQLDRLLASLPAHGHVCVHHLDLARFKDVNDTFGHVVGDEVIRQVADRLRACIGDGDMVFRIGGDEFVLLQTVHNTAEDAPRLANRILEVVGEPFEIGGQIVKIDGSVGFAIAPEDGNTTELLARHSDVALRGAKCEGPGHWKAFEAGMEERLRERRGLERDLRAALSNGELEVHYQPILGATTRRICGAEALLRWRHPTRGMVSPAEFIPVAEESGLIGDIGAWVLRTACAQAANWPTGMRISVNLSPLQFKKGGLVSLVADTLAETGLAPGCLELELTETALLSDGDQTVDVLQQIRAQGVRIALDDFGTGYSSLAYLRRFPFDKIKIDRCFISDLSDERDDAVAFVRAICALGQALNLTITAEGVETEEQLTAVAREGCSEIQGYIFSPPVRADVLGEFIRGPSGPLPGMPQSLRDTFKLSATSILPFEKTSAQTS